MAYDFNSIEHQHRQRYLVELLETLTKAVERMTRRLAEADREDLETLRLILHELRRIADELAPPPTPSTLSRSSAVQFTVPQ